MSSWQSAYPPPPEPLPPVPGEQGWADVSSGWRTAPRELRVVVVLLFVNLLLSITLTVLTIALRHSLVDYQLDHRHVTDPHQRDLLRTSYSTGLIGRVLANIAVSVVYAFLVRALLRGRRWAYRRIRWITVAGCIGLVVIQFEPYPTWMRVEQLLQAAVLVALFVAAGRGTVRAHFAPGLPGRDVPRFRRQ